MRAYGRLLAMALGAGLAGMFAVAVAAAMAFGDGMLRIDFNGFGEGWMELAGFSLMAAFLLWITVKEWGEPV